MLRHETVEPGTFALLKQLQSLPFLDGVRLAGVRDIGAMKLLAITKRGAKKDFVDLCFLLQRFSVSEMVGWFKEKYPAFDPFLVMRSLAYFEDADSDLPPTMLVPFDWEEAKAAIREAVRAYAR